MIPTSATELRTWRLPRYPFMSFALFPVIVVEWHRNCEESDADSAHIFARRSVTMAKLIWVRLAILLCRATWRRATTATVGAITTLLAFVAVAQVAKPVRPGFNFEEDKIPPYTLPDPLVMFDGTPVTSLAEWREHRRPEILRRFETDVYGRRPDPLSTMRFELVESDAKALDDDIMTCPCNGANP